MSQKPAAFAVVAVLAALACAVVDSVNAARASCDDNCRVKTNFMGCGTPPLPCGRYDLGQCDLCSPAFHGLCEYNSDANAATCERCRDIPITYNHYLT